MHRIADRILAAPWPLEHGTNGLRTQRVQVQPHGRTRARVEHVTWTRATPPACRRAEIHELGGKVAGPPQTLHDGVDVAVVLPDGVPAVRPLPQPCCVPAQAGLPAQAAHLARHPRCKTPIMPHTSSPDISLSVQPQLCPQARTHPCKALSRCAWHEHVSTAIAAWPRMEQGPSPDLVMQPAAQVAHAGVLLRCCSYRICPMLQALPPRGLGRVQACSWGEFARDRLRDDDDPSPAAALTLHPALGKCFPVMPPAIGPERYLHSLPSDWM